MISQVFNEVFIYCSTSNRAEFRAVAWQSLRELCQGGKLGDVEMLLQFAWCTESGAIHVGL